jgi:hypothetical protein
MKTVIGQVFGVVLFCAVIYLVWWLLRWLTH